MELTWAAHTQSGHSTRVGPDYSPVALCPSAQSGRDSDSGPQALPLVCLLMTSISTLHFLPFSIPSRPQGTPHSCPLGAFTKLPQWSFKSQPRDLSSRNPLQPLCTAVPLLTLHHGGLHPTG